MNAEVEANLNRINTLRDKGSSFVAVPDLVKEVIGVLQTVSNPQFKAHISTSRKAIREAFPHILRLCPTMAACKARDGITFHDLHYQLQHTTNEREEINKRISTAINHCDNYPSTSTTIR